MNKEKLFFIDAYALIYRSYYAFIRNPRINSKGENTSAIFGFVNTLEDVLATENPTHIGIAFDPPGPTFRHEAYEEYKAQRESTPEDIKKSVPIIKEIIKAYRIPILEVESYEADDVIGTLATQAGKKQIPTYMLTSDKDYGQLVTDNIFMYRPKHKGGYEVLGIEEIKNKFKIENPTQVIDILALMGDASDNIPGCPGIGEVRAQRLIEEFGSVENLIANTNQLKGTMKKNIEENIKGITFSKFLATIKKDVPIELKLDELIREQEDEEKIKEIFEELEFRTFLRRKYPEENQSAPTLFDQTNLKKKDIKEAIQGDLFSNFVEEHTGNEKNRKDLALENNVIKYKLIDNQKAIDELASILCSKKEIALDTETTGTEPMEAELVGFSFSYQPNEAFYIPVPEKKEDAKKIVEKFKTIFENPEIVKIGQNIKYDIIILKRYGINIQGPLFDTMIAHYLIQPELRHGMDYLAEIYLNHQTIPIEHLIGPKGKNQKTMRDLTPEEVYFYACEDADITFRLKEKLEKELKENDLEYLFYNIEMPLVPVLVEMEVNGVRLDTEALKKISKKLTDRLISLEEKIHTIAGTNFNVSSPKQVGEILFDHMKLDDKAKKTKSGQYVTSEEVLLKYKNKHEIVEKILEFRGLRKLLNTYVDALPKLINPNTHRIHTSFNQTVTATGRLSSSNPNLQNIPIRDDDGREIRKAFIPDEDNEFFSADYSQIELRIMAHLSNDIHMIEAFNKGYDIHTATAAKIYKTEVDDVTPNMRDKAKTANFGIIYGISVFGLAERLNIERKEAKQLIDGYFESYPDVSKYMEESKEKAKEQGYVETLFKRKRFLPDINSKNSIVRGFAERNAINAPIQGSAADIIKVAMSNIFRRFKEEGLKSKMILQVHDELNFSVPIEEKEKVEKIVIQEMEHAYNLKVPLKVDCGWGKNWLEAH